MSSAHLIEATRLADALAAMRGRRDPILEDIVDATRAVMTDGSDVPLAVVRRELIVGTRIGKVPESVPTAPLAADFERRRKSLRLKVSDTAQQLDLDLRTPTDLGRSHLLHRLTLLDIDWGTPRRERLGHGAGTFHEFWKLLWKPEYAVDLIVASRYGNTIEMAASAKAMELAGGDATGWRRLTELLESVLLASLPDAAAAIVERLGAVAAVAADVPALMAALPPLARVMRYGNVRGTDASMVAGIVDATVTRICVGLAPACASLDPDAARDMGGLIDGVSAAIGLLDDKEQRAAWQASLAGLARDEDLAGLVRGRACRILLDERVLDSDGGRGRDGPLAVARPRSRWRPRASSRGSCATRAWCCSTTRRCSGCSTRGWRGWTARRSTGCCRCSGGRSGRSRRRSVGRWASGRRACERTSKAAIGFDAEAADAVLPILSTILGIDLVPGGAAA